MTLGIANFIRAGPIPTARGAVRLGPVPIVACVRGGPMQAPWLAGRVVENARLNLDLLAPASGRNPGVDR